MITSSFVGIGEYTQLEVSLQSVKQPAHGPSPSVATGNLMDVGSHTMFRISDWPCFLTYDHQKFELKKEKFEFYKIKEGVVSFWFIFLLENGSIQRSFK